MLLVRLRVRVRARVAHDEDALGRVLGGQCGLGLLGREQADARGQQAQRHAHLVRVGVGVGVRARV